MNSFPGRFIIDGVFSTQKLKLNFDATAESIDFDNKDAAAAKINAWSAEATKGKIENLIEVNFGIFEICRIKKNWKSEIRL